MNIGVDLDGVLFDIQGVEKTVCEKLGVTWIPSNDWSYSNFSPEVREAIYIAFSNKTLMVDEIDYLHPVQDIKDVMQKLVDSGHKLHIISARTYDVAEATTDKIIADFGKYLSSITIAPMKSKIPIIYKFDIDLMIDDSPGVIEECIDNDINCLVVSNSQTPYNKVIWAENSVSSFDYISSFLEIDKFLNQVNKI